MEDKRMADKSMEDKRMQSPGNLGTWSAA